MFGRKQQRSSTRDLQQPVAATIPPVVPQQPRKVDEHSVQQPATSKEQLEQLGNLRKTALDRIDASVAAQLTHDELENQVHRALEKVAKEQGYPLAATELQRLVSSILDDMTGLGPIQQLLNDEAITDIMVNGPDQVFVERHGKLELSNVTFRDNTHVQHVAQRIASTVGRRIDESSPMVDARLLDGSRVNIIAPPLALGGTCISIRKFSKDAISLEGMVQHTSLSAQMASLLQVAAECRLNILVSGGTGAGKTTLLNAMSQLISPDERIVTIEDAAELRLLQPHVVTLETRPPSTEGTAEVTLRDLLINSLRMRPDRIIVGEVRGAEAFEMMQAMNTGHDGSMSTLHANSPKDALLRLENMLLLNATQVPVSALRRQIASAVNIIVQVERMRDGVRRIVSITEITGVENDTIVTQELFTFQQEKTTKPGEVSGSFTPCSARPMFTEKAAFFGLEQKLANALGA
ncbi:CpaF family protein [Halodesulfovibrio sp.]|jgi:pilus assembly protein CpaF|uniref:CpaF family protein n=1 Tax=Halodesulfovibrio sp. TaxID=1912772 RepID=UPI0025FB2F80|nr:CpaF family protein [Halodesulfovibrio sp.]MCT4535245.1 CpaF family protein [Halodesulfovibrio sp.]